MKTTCVGLGSPPAVCCCLTSHVPHVIESACAQVVKAAHEVGLHTTSTIMVRLRRAYVAAYQTS